MYRRSPEIRENLNKKKKGYMRFPAASPALRPRFRVHRFFGGEGKVEVETDVHFYQAKIFFAVSFLSLQVRERHVTVG